MPKTIVLNADANHETQKIVSELLLRLDVDVQEASNIADAVRFATEVRPAVAVVASELDGESGAALSRQLAGTGPMKRILRIAGSDGSLLTDGSADIYLPEPLDSRSLVGATRSLLALREAEQEREFVRQELLRTQDEFHRCMSRTVHDFSEPLRAFATFLDLLQRGSPNRLEESESRYLDLVVLSVERSRDLLRDLTAYVHLLRDSPSSLSTIQLEGPVLAAQASHLREMEAIGTKLHIGPLPTIHGNVAQLQQLMTCLLSNALKYRNPERPLKVSIRAEKESNGRWRITVTDNGIGIEPQYHESILSPFQRLHGRDVPGTGMGLAVCDRIVRMHGGKLWVESVPGEGATFLFTLAPQPLS